MPSSTIRRWQSPTRLPRSTRPTRCGRSPGFLSSSPCSAVSCLCCGMPFASVPRTATELAELEASYRPFSGAAEWSNLSVDGARWRRFAHVLACRRAAAGARAWSEATERLLGAAALDSSALDGLFPANPQLTGMVLDGSSGDASGGGGAADPVELVAECHRRALVLASEAAADGREVSAHLIAVLQDVITESQASYTVTTESGAAVEVDMPRR